MSSTARSASGRRPAVKVVHGQRAHDPEFLFQYGDNSVRTRVAQLDPATARPAGPPPQRACSSSSPARRGGHHVPRGVVPGDAATHRVTSDHREPCPPPPGSAAFSLGRGRLCFTHPGGSLRALSPHTGRHAWENRSTVRSPGPALASATQAYVSPPGGRLAALDRRTGHLDGTLPGRDDAGSTDITDRPAPPVLVGDALYVPYGIRSVCAVDIRDL